MKEYLIIGLGSMGKRRVRCLLHLGVPCEAVIGMDRREDRRKEAQEKYGIRIAEKEEEIDFSGIEAVIVSLPPDRHYLGAQVAFRHKKPVFTEASVMLEDMRKIREGNTEDVFVAPSCTLLFHPALKKIRELVNGRAYGKVCNFSYHSGQYLPDWHPWENVKDFYVSNRQTGGAREIVPFELTWITALFGYPRQIKGYYRKTRDVGCDIEDSYVCALDYEDMVGSLLVDVVGRNGARNLLINLEDAQIQWRWDRRVIEVYEAETGAWKYIEVDEELHEKGYNENIGENMYIEELGAFLAGIENREAFPNTVEKDMAVLGLLEAVEGSDGWQPGDIGREAP